MTSAGARPCCLRRHGFTLVELLVVIGIIVLLLGLAAPMITRAWRAGDRAATFSDLQAIATALEAYRQDHGDYPRVRQDTSIPPRTYSATEARPNPPSGAQILCQALIAPAPAQEPGTGPANQRKVQDGAEGPGFRIRGGTPTQPPQGKVYGPYLPPGRFKVADPAAAPTAPMAANRWLLATILDRYNKPILYFPGSLTKPKLNVAGTTPPFVAQSEMSLYDANDNLQVFDTNATNAVRKIRLILGDASATPGTTANGIIDPGETPAHTGPFVLWSAGPDETFGPRGDEAEPRNNQPDFKDAQRCDDITNFRQ